MADFQSGQVTALPGTNGNDCNQLWSPDGKWIVFMSRNLYFLLNNNAIILLIEDLRTFLEVFWFIMVESYHLQ